MLLQTNSYIVPKEKRAEHARLMRRFRQVLHHLGCDSFEVHEQVGANWSSGSATGRFVQIMRFRDRKHQLAVQNAERTDPTAQELIAEFCELVNYPYQQQNGLFAVGFYSSVLPVAPVRPTPAAEEAQPAVAEMPGEGQEQEQQEVAAEQGVEAVGEESAVGDEAEESAGIDVEEGSIVEGEALPDEGAATEEMAGVEGGAFGEETSDQTPFATVERGEGDAEEQPVAAQAGEGDDWSVMDQAQSIEDAGEEALGVELETAAPANGEQGESEQEQDTEIDLGLDHREDDDIAEMADRLAERVDEDADADVDAGAGAPSASDKRAGRGR